MRYWIPKPAKLRYFIPFASRRSISFALSISFFRCDLINFHSLCALYLRFIRYIFSFFINKLYIHSPCIYSLCSHSLCIHSPCTHSFSVQLLGLFCHAMWKSTSDHLVFLVWSQRAVNKAHPSFKFNRQSQIHKPLHSLFRIFSRHLSFIIYHAPFQQEFNFSKSV